jgi:hypothetical protein
VILLLAIVIVLALIVIAANSFRSNAAKDARYQHKVAVRQRQRPLGYLFFGLFIALLAWALLHPTPPAP